MAEATESSGAWEKNPKLHCLAGHSNYPGRLSYYIFQLDSCLIRVLAFVIFCCLHPIPVRVGESLLATHRIATKILRSPLTAQSNGESAS